MSTTLEGAPQEAAQPAEEPKPTPPPAVEPAPAQEPDWKAEARKWEARAKENSDAAKRLAEIEEAFKTEAQKAAERLAAAEAKVKEYETREQIAAWKAEVAEATGVPATVLAGSTKEEIEAHAETLKPLISASQQPAAPQPIPGEGRAAPIPLNGDGIESALRKALGIS